MSSARDETGIVIAADAGTRIVRVTTRFCFAPTSSSPSMMRIGAKLAAEREVHPRTIRRDLETLCRAGFPLYDGKINGTAMWKVRARPFRMLEETGMGSPSWRRCTSAARC